MVLTLLLLWHGAGKDGYGGSGETGASYSHNVQWRIKLALVGSEVMFGALVLNEVPVGPSLGFVGFGVGSGGILERFVYQLWKLGWSTGPISADGFLPLWGLLFASVLGLSHRCQTPSYLTKRWVLGILSGSFVQRIQRMLVLPTCFSP